MKNSEKLFPLIKSLKQSEKRYFRLFISSYVKEKNKYYMKLFEAINKQKEFDEKAIRHQLQKKDKDFSRHYRFTKHYLYQLILKSLRMYYSESSVDVQLKDIIHSVKICRMRER